MFDVFISIKTFSLNFLWLFHRAECESAGGTEDGDCADGFGQCCISMTPFYTYAKLISSPPVDNVFENVTMFCICFLAILSDGATTSLNQSYIVKSGTSTIETSTYTICPCSSDVCRIRFDFTVNKH